MYIMKKKTRCTHTHPYTHNTHSELSPAEEANNAKPFLFLCCETVFAVLHIKFLYAKSCRCTTTHHTPYTTHPCPSLAVNLQFGSHFSSVIFGAANLVGMHNFFLMPLPMPRLRPRPWPMPGTWWFANTAPPHPLWPTKRLAWEAAAATGIERCFWGNEIFKCLLPS